MSYINFKRYFAIALSIVMLSGISVFGFAQQVRAEDSKVPDEHRRKLLDRHQRQDKGQLMLLHGAQRLGKKDLWIPVTSTTVHTRYAVSQLDLSPETAER